VTGSTSLRGPRVRTLRTPAEFRRVLQGGLRFVQGRVVLHVLSVLPERRDAGDPATGPEPRVGFVTGRRVGGAVIRNRARRLLREAWRALLPQVESGTEAVLVARPEILGAKAQDVVDDVRRALTRAGVISS
jgi:ribonuclease P protein component